ncbi:MAG: hypothetical protein U9N85_01810 [Bacteroidota bacterium]|nr:hypothetical protein [Bacteroidota bacterium]
MKIISFVNVSILSMLLLMSTACIDMLLSESDECENPDYSDCDTFEPYSAFLKLHVSTESDLELIELKLYTGDIEEGELIVDFPDSLFDSSPIVKEVRLDKKFSAKAVYVRGQDTIACIDGTETKRHSYTNCDSTCWRISGDELYLEIAR